ncbi:MAG TPA: hypothetical protein QF458_00010, partial [Candidatus Woesearchaeota archaeon]|nr:hypothetical protein [Candidatus Woesearchaeota archaeon]
DKCYCPTTPRSQDINKCEAIDEAEESCPSCWCPGWTDVVDASCGDLGCDWNKVPQSRTCKPGSCDSETDCDTRDSCDCLLDAAEADTKCMDDPCSSYVPGTCDPILSDCACLTGNACMGDCDVCTYGLWEDVGGCGDGTCAADGVPQEKESTNGCATETRCRPDPSCP